MTPPTLQVLLSGAFGVAAGALSGFLGIGGGAILPPLLVFALGFGQHRAQGISLAALLPPVGLPAVLAYRRQGIAIVPLFVVSLAVGFGLGAFVGASVAHFMPSRQLAWGFATFLAYSAYRAASPGPTAAEHSAAMPRSSATLLWFGLPIGAAAGFMSGLLGIGGGIVALPLLKRFARLPRLEAQATTLALMLPPIGLPAVFVYAQQPGGLPWPILAAVALGFAIGAGVGASLGTRADARVAERVYGAFLAVMAVLLVVRS